MTRLLRLLALAGAAALLVAGCAAGYLLDNNVQSFSGLPALPAQPTYRFERLPSQAVLPGQTELEALADPALFNAGLRRDDAQPRYSVQVSARIERMLSPWADPWWGAGYAGPRWGWGFGGPFPRMEQPWYQRQVGVIVRELAGNKVVFESHASNEGPYLNPDMALAAMFDAALQGFPNPPLGPRRVNIQLGGTAPAAGPAPATSAPRPAASAVR